MTGKWIQPPKAASWLMKICYRDQGVFTTVGDLDEVYQTQVAETGRLKAALWYWRESIQGLFLMLWNLLLWRLTITGHEVRMAVRHLNKARLYAFINIIGLSLGLASAMLIALFVYHEQSFDRFHCRADRIYRLCMNMEMYGRMTTSAIAHSRETDAVLPSLPELEAVVCMTQHYTISTHTEDQKFSVNPLYVDANFFQVFDFELLAGDAATVLIEPGSVVITPELARRYFGQEEPLGQTIHLEDRGPLQVTGIMKPVPQNSHIQAEFVVSRQVLADRSVLFNTYLLFRDRINVAAMEKHINELVNSHRSRPSTSFYTLQPLTDIHFSPVQGLDLARKSQARVSQVLMGLGVIVMLVSIINFTNLSVARALGQMRETALRKILGANRRGLVRQHLLAALLYAWMAMLIGFGMMVLALPHVEHWARWEFGNHLKNSLALYGIFASVTTVTGLMAGLYPALYISATQPLIMLRKSFMKSHRRSGIRHSLTSFQVFIAVALMLVTGVMFLQVRYLSRADLGADIDHTANISLFKDKGISNHKKAFLEKLRAIAGVEYAIFTTFIPGSDFVREDVVQPGERKDETLRMPVIEVDAGFFDFFSLELSQGRRFSEERVSDHGRAVIINETAAAQLGWDDVLGKTLTLPRREAPAQIVGVVKDFHMHSLRYPIKPMVFLYYTGYMPGITVRLRAGAGPETVAAMKTVWNELATEEPFENQYFVNQSVFPEMRLVETLRLAIVFSFFLALMGFLGLSAFGAGQRVREVGIRKVLGATGAHLSLLLSRQLVLLALGGAILAWLPAWFYSRYWLQNFAYQVDYPFWLYPAVTATVLVSLFLIVNIHISMTTRMNPVKILRNE